MRRTVLVSIIVACLLAAPGAAAGDGGSRPRLTESDGSGYHVDSPFIRDAHGRVRIFHGVNAVWKLPPYYPPSVLFGDPKSGSYFDHRDARFLARNGLNSVRLGNLFVATEPEQGTYDDAYLDRVEEIVDMLADHDVTVMVDFHQDMYNERYEGEGFPDWSVYDDGIPPTNCCGFPGNYFTPAVTHVFDNLWINRNAIWDDYRDAWMHVVERFKHKPNLIGYDLLNEPWPGSQTSSCANTEGCPLFDTEFLQPFFEHVIAGIRDVDVHSIIWWDANVITNSGAKNNVGLNSPIADPGNNQGISFHVYCIAGSPTTGIRPGDDPTCPISEPIAFENQVEAAERNSSSLFLTEFGASDDRRDIRRVTNLADEHMSSWHYWHYGDWMDPTTTGTGEQSLYEDDLDRDTLKETKVKALIRTYPQAVAGTPESFKFYLLRKSKKFLLTYKADASIDAPTVVFVPVRRHYEGRYKVTVEGPAEVVSKKNAKLLKLRNTGNGRVDLILRKRRIRDEELELSPPRYGRRIRNRNRGGRRSAGSATRTGPVLSPLQV